MIALARSSPLVPFFAAPTLLILLSCTPTTPAISRVPASMDVEVHTAANRLPVSLDAYGDAAATQVPISLDVYGNVVISRLMASMESVQPGLSSKAQPRNGRQPASMEGLQPAVTSKAQLRGIGIYGSQPTTPVQRSSSPPAAAVVELFQMMIKMAEEVNKTSGSEEAAILLLRSALQMCPSCPPPVPAPGLLTHRVFHTSAERLYMINDIFPAIYQLQDVKRILWVGVEPYTLWYEYILRDHNISMTTIASATEPSAALYVSSTNHITDNVQNLAMRTAPRSFDVVIINEVSGWGLATEQEVTRALKAMHSALRFGGWMISGYNLGQRLNDKFEPYFVRARLGALPQKVDTSKTASHHVYEFYQKGSPEFYQKGGLITRAPEAPSY